MLIGGAGGRLKMGLGLRALQGTQSVKMPFWGLCSKPPSTYLNPTKCFKPISSVYTRPWKLWLRSKSSIGGAGGGPNMAFRAENTIFSAKMHTLGLCSNPKPAYLNSTKCLQPTSSVYTWPWKLWLGPPVMAGGCGGRPNMHKKHARMHKKRAHTMWCMAHIATMDWNFWGLYMFPYANILPLWCF